MFLPPFHWALPVYREPIWFETFISNFLGWTRYKILRIINKSDVLMRILNHPYRTFVDLFPIFVVISILFFLFDFWQKFRAQAAEKTVYELLGDTPEVRPRTLPSMSRATAANTSSQPGPSVERLQSVLKGGIPGRLSPEVGKNVRFDVGRSSPGPQTPSTGSNVSNLKHADSVLYYTLQKSMRLVADWTPAKDGEEDDDYEVATLYDPPTRTYGNVRRRKDVGK